MERFHAAHGSRKWHFLWLRPGYRRNWRPQVPPKKKRVNRVHYRDYPNHMQMCGMCKFFEGDGMMGDGMMGDGMMGDGMMGGGMMGGGMMGHGMMAGECEIVKGRISHMGWCDLYAPRGL